MEVGLPMGIMFNPEYHLNKWLTVMVHLDKFLHSALIGLMSSKRNKGVELRWLVYGKPN